MFAIWVVSDQFSYSLVWLLSTREFSTSIVCEIARKRNSIRFCCCAACMVVLVWSEMRDVSWLLKILFEGKVLVKDSWRPRWTTPTQRTVFQRHFLRTALANNSVLDATWNSCWSLYDSGAAYARCTEARHFTHVLLILLSHIGMSRISVRYCWRMRN